jgi:hypothetical protein
MVTFVSRPLTQRAPSAESIGHNLAIALVLHTFPVYNRLFTSWRQHCPCIMDFSASLSSSTVTLSRNVGLSTFLSCLCATLCFSRRFSRSIHATAFFSRCHDEYLANSRSTTICWSFPTFVTYTVCAPPTHCHHRSLIWPVCSLPAMTTASLSESRGPSFIVHYPSGLQCSDLLTRHLLDSVWLAHSAITLAVTHRE